jgi:choline-sulfatase
MRPVWVSALLGLWLLPLPLPGAEPRPPNVLWICADDFAPYVCGAYGNRMVKTPNLDRLAAEGLRFDRAYCNSPVCTASRQSFLTGQYPRTLGVTLLKTPLPDDTPTLARLLKRGGYDTAAIGKMHFNSDLTHGFDLRLDLTEHRRWLQKKGAQPLPEGVEVLPPWKPFRDPARVWLNGSYRPFGATDADMPGTWFADRAVQYLGERKDKSERPFFLMVSFYEPHSPFHFPVEFRDRHKPESFAVPKVGPEDDWQIPEVFRDLSEREKQGIIASYYTSAEFMDRNVGRVLDALKRAGLDGQTLVIFNGDHGYMLGQHGRFEKHCGYEPAIRSPLILRGPGLAKPGRGTSALVEFIDVVPTVLELCKQLVPATVQGRSLLPLYRGERDTHREQVFVEYSENEEALIRTDRWKLIYGTGKRQRQDGYATGKPLPGRTVQLFDLEQDPEEMTNLAKHPDQAKRVADLTARLAEHLKRTAREPDRLPRTDDVHELLEFCLQPRDVTPKEEKRER